MDEASRAVYVRDMQDPNLSREEVARYSRHLILPEVGMSGQKKLKTSSVLCIGSGGLGSPLLMYLAAAGVGRIGVVDFDVVDESNLQRQVLHGTEWLGQPKVESARARMAQINPWVHVDVFNTRLTRDNALRILEPYDVVVDGTDNFPTRYLANDACVLLDKPYVYGSIYRFEGQASVFNVDGGPDYRDLCPSPPPPEFVPNCAEGGVLGVLPGLVGVIQATETIKLLTGLGKTLSGRLLLIDALTMAFREIKLKRDPRRARVEGLIDYEDFCRVELPSDETPFERITALELKRRLDEGWQPYILDVRKPHEAEIVSLPHVDRLHPHESVAEIVDELPRDQDIVVACKSGGRSTKAAGTLAAAGFTRLFNLDGGVLGWAEQVDPTLPIY